MGLKSIMKFLLLSVAIVFASSAGASDALTSKLKERFGDKIEVEYLSDLSSYEIKSARLIEERSQGRFDFFINGEQKINIEANIYVGAYFPKNKIKPREQLSEDMFEVKRLNIVREKGHQFRAVILSIDEPLSEYQSKQTLLPGDFLTINSIQKTPVVKVGERVQMRLWSGGVMLNAPIVIQQAGFIGDTIQVEVLSTKKQLQGKLIDAQTVEVHL